MYHRRYDLFFDPEHWAKECRLFRLGMALVIMMVFAVYGAVGLAVAAVFGLQLVTVLTVCAVIAGALSLLPACALIGATPRKVWNWQNKEIYVKA